MKIASLLCGVLLLAAAAIAPAQKAQLLIERDAQGLSILGDVSSAANAEILRATAASKFPNANLDMQTSESVLLPPDWSLITDQTLRALADTYSAKAVVTQDSIQIAGLASNADDWEMALARLRSHLGTAYSLHANVAIVSNGRTMRDMCSQMYDAALEERQVEFSNSSTTLSTSAHALLDTLLLLARDCDPSEFRISAGAHDVATGEARARAIRDYLVAGGIAADRIVVEGRSASGRRAGRVHISVKF